MSNLNYPQLALGMGLLVAIGILMSGALGPAEGYDLPVLTMLIVNEFGFFVTAIGVGVGINTMMGKGATTGMVIVSIACAVLAVLFLYLGIKMWPGFI